MMTSLIRRYDPSTRMVIVTDLTARLQWRIPAEKAQWLRWL